jgi:hypothetical protein
MLSHYQSPVNCRSTIVEGNFTHKANYRYCCYFPGLEFIQLPVRVDGFPSQERYSRILKSIYFLKLYWKRWLAMSLYAL